MIIDEKRKQFFTKNAVYLNPLKPSKMLKSRGMMSFDIETKDGLIAEKIFCWSLCYKKGKSVQLLSDRNDTLSESCGLDKLFNFLLNLPNDKKHKRVIWVHNLYFEARHLLVYCVKHDIKYFSCLSGSNMLSFSLVDYNIKFMDSAQLLLSSQEQAELDWNVDESLRKIDCQYLFEHKKFKNWSKKDKDKVVVHNLNDTQALLDIMTKYRKTIFEIAYMDILTITSLASMGMKAFRISMNEPLLNPFLYLWFEKSVNHFVYKYQKIESEFVRRSYFGGRTEVFNNSLLENGVYIDRVSAYSAIMKDKKFPVGIGYWVKDKKILMNAIKGKNTLEGFIECKIIPSKLKYPILPERKNKRVIYTNCKRTNVYTLPELKFAFKHGYIIMPISGFMFEDSKLIFTGFIEKFYKIKEESKKLGQTGKSKSAKYTMHAVYGKFSQQYEHKSNVMHYFLSSEEQIEFLQANEELEIVKNTHDEKSQIYISIESKHNTMIKAFMNVCISSYITAYQRIALYEQLESCEQKGIEIYYTDTDSYTAKDEILSQIEISKELGGWDIEETFYFVKFLAPKCYLFDHYDKKEKKRMYAVKMKGIPSREIKRILKTAEYYFWDLEDSQMRKRGMLFIEKLMRTKIMFAERYITFNESHRSGMLIGSKIKSKHYTMSNLKRNFQSDGTSIAWDNSNLPEEFVKEG